MIFNFDCEHALDCDRNGISILEGDCQNRIIPGYLIYVKEILDKMGQLSARAQNLESVITSTSRFFPSNHRLFLKANKNMVLGYIKVGPKKLFVRDRLFNYHERKSLCVLDFYVYDSVQRQGIGKELFDFMLNYEKIAPDVLAYDRPTLRLLAFLKKNYGLENYITQNNSFIIFDNFFSPNSILNIDTEFDNDTHRVIQSLQTPKNIYDKYYRERKYVSNSNYVRNNNSPRQSPQINPNNYKNNEYNNDNNYNRTESNNNRLRSMSPIGEQLIYSNDFRNNPINKDRYRKPNLNDNEGDYQYNNRYQQDNEYNRKNNYENSYGDKYDYNQPNNNYRSQDYSNRKGYQDYQMNRKASPRNGNSYFNTTEYTDNYNLDNYYNNKKQ